MSYTLICILVRSFKIISRLTPSPYIAYKCGLNTYARMFTLICGRVYINIHLVWVYMFAYLWFLVFIWIVFGFEYLGKRTKQKNQEKYIYILCCLSYELHCLFVLQNGLHKSNTTIICMAHRLSSCSTAYNYPEFHPESIHNAAQYRN